VIQVGGHPDAAECVNNWWMLQDAGLESLVPEDAAIIAYLEKWYRQLSAPPAIELVREYFEKDDKIEVVERLEEIKRAQSYIRTNFIGLCKSERDQQDRKRVIRVLRDTAAITEHGMHVGKRTLRGVQDGMSYMQEHLASVGQKQEDVNAHEAVAAFLNQARAPRLHLGVPALDTSHHGRGLPAPRFIVLGGAPGAGKTSLATFMAHTLMGRGHAVSFLAVDEGPEGVAGRLAAIEGVLGDLLQLSDDQCKPVSEEAAAFREGFLQRIGQHDPTAALSAMARLPFFASESATIEQMTERLLRFAERRKLSGVAPVMVVDSLQRCRSRGSDAAPDPRQRVDAVLAACKRAVARGLVVIATSEVNRGAYRSKKIDEQVTDMAATKESGYIEFAAQTLLILRTTAGDDVVSVTTPKNRGGSHPAFRLRLDRTQMSYTEAADDGDALTRAQLQLTEDTDTLRAVVLANKLSTIRALRAACQAGGKLTNNERIDAARAHLEARGVLVKEGGVYKVVELQAEDCLQ
jgi:KaiC/GvpD/RAD55 family RecA-like ATPase